ncbi:6-phosphogluconate dehydrogenase [Gracilaria domingensis]|nr:6-phosphogluconate dehydrogenase [Gracilaria domingensis]
MPYPEKARICVVGAGAIGGLLGVELSRRGHNVAFFARGAHLAAMKKEGRSSQIDKTGWEHRRIRKWFYVHSITRRSWRTRPCDSGIENASDQGCTSGSSSYNRPAHCCAGNAKWDSLVSADPGGVLKTSIDPKKLIATVVYPAAVVASPGVIRHVEGIRFPIGEPNGQTTERVQWVSTMLIDAGFKSPVLEDVRGEMWLKLWGTVAVNPLSALTHATLDVLCTIPAGREVVVLMMKEVEKVANRLGSKMRLPIERRVNGAAKVGRHKTSMLQDVEAGREMEIETIMGAVVEMARVCGEDTPSIDTIYGTIRMLAFVMKEEKSKVCMIPVEG